MQLTTMPYAFFSNFHWYNVDDEDNLWVSSFGSIRVFEPGTLRELRKEKTDIESYLLQSVNLTGRGIMVFYYSTGLKFFDYKKKREFKLSLSNDLISYLNPTILYAAISFANGYLFAGAEIDALQYIDFSSVTDLKTPRACYLSGIQVFNKPYPTDTLPEYLHTLKLSHKNNFITLTVSSTEFGEPEGLEYRYRLSGIDKEWIHTNYLTRTISYPALRPGDYVFYTSIRNEDGSWSDSKINLGITIVPEWWQTMLFKISAFAIVLCLLIVFNRRRIQSIRKKEQQKARHEKELIELEAKALRAQMNPHFVFNCLNSIKSLIQLNENEKSVTYLTTFSKLIRTLLNNAEKKEISLYDEIETCKYYLQLEAMRFDTKFSYSVSADENIDLKSVQVPALIIQPFIENAIWHGIIPRSTEGSVFLNVLRNDGSIEIVIEDNGIGREASRQNRSASGLTHQSKGVNLTQSRLELDSLLQQRQAKVEIIDKKNESGISTGTKVIITISQER
jgi:two-component sensor histidine kinase